MSEIIAIVVTYNGQRWIEKCLDSLLKSTLQPQIIIIDNASTDKTKSIIRERYPRLHLIENKENLGFGQANNIGMRAALSQQAEFVLLLNQDAYVYPDTLEKLAAVQRSHSQYGIISPLQQNHSGEKFDALFRKFISNNYPPDFVRKIESGDAGLPAIFPVRFVNAACWLVSLKCLQTTGLFHPLFYHYGEDNNYSSRAQYHGFKVGVTPSTAVRHDKTYESPANGLLRRQIELVPLYILLDLRKAVLAAYPLVFWKMVGYSWKSLKKRSPSLIRFIFKRAAWIITHVPLIVRTRRESKKPYS